MKERDYAFKFGLLGEQYSYRQQCRLFAAVGSGRVPARLPAVLQPVAAVCAEVGEITEQLVLECFVTLGWHRGPSPATTQHVIPRPQEPHQCLLPKRKTYSLAMPSIKKGCARPWEEGQTPEVQELYLRKKVQVSYGVKSKWSEK